MGCGASSVSPGRFVVRPGVRGQEAGDADEFGRLRLSAREVDRLFGCFSALDPAGLGLADLAAFYRYFGFTPSSFCDRVFSRSEEHTSVLQSPMWP